MARIDPGLTVGKNILLTAAGLVALGAPIVIGVMTSQVSHARAGIRTAAAPAAMAADHFDVASVKPAEMPTPIRRHSPGRIRYEGISLYQLIRKAFALPDYQMVLPDWVPGVPKDHLPKEKVDPRYFTIEATMPPETTDAEFRLMLQNLLVERFNLAFHRETRPLAQYEISFVEGGPKMTKAKPLLDGPTQHLPDDNEGLDRWKYGSSSLTFGEVGMRVTGAYQLAVLAEQFSMYLQHPLVDRTGSAEYYAVDLTWGWNPNSLPSVPGATNRATDREARELFVQMERKLGLKVTLRSVPTEVLVVDRLSHEATEN